MLSQTTTSFLMATVTSFGCNVQKLEMEVTKCIYLKMKFVPFIK